MRTQWSEPGNVAMHMFVAHTDIGVMSSLSFVAIGGAVGSFLLAVGIGVAVCCLWSVQNHTCHCTFEQYHVFDINFVISMLLQNSNPAIVVAES